MWQVILLMAVNPSPTLAVPQTSTGFYYPTDDPGPWSFFGWLLYVSDSGYHLAQDMERPAYTNVYAIWDGDVVYRGSAGPGTVLIVQHPSDQGDFYAYYAHVYAGVGKGDRVSAGQAIGTMYDQGGNSHLHFAVNPTRIVIDHFGYTWNLGDLKGFVDPVNWIRTRRPGNCESWEPCPGAGAGQRCIRADGSWDLRPPAGGEYWLRGALLYQYKRASGCLCWPTSDWQPGWSSPRGADSWYMRFQGGSIVEITGHKYGCWLHRTTAVCDGIFDVWYGLGNMHSWLGGPIANYQTTENRNALHRPLNQWENKFEGGYITQLASDKPYRAYPYLWHVEGDPTLWWNDLGTRRVFRRWAPFLEWVAARDLPTPPAPVVTVSGTAVTRQELNATPVGRAMPPLIKSFDRATVYYLDFTSPDPRRRSIPDQTVFGNWGFEWWEVSSRPQTEVDKYALGGSLPDYPPEVRSVSAPRTVPLGQAIVVKWKLKGFPGGPVDKTGVSYRVVGGAKKGIAGTKTSTGWRARIPTRGLASGTVIRWYIYAVGDGLTAEWPQVYDGKPWRRTKVGTAAGTTPTLKWAGLSGYTADGVEPNRGTANQTRFVFRVKYIDGDGDTPDFVRLRIKRNGALYRVLGMHAVSGAPTTGQVFYRATTLPRGTYAYRFVVEDDDGRAGLPADAWKAGPSVTTTTAISAASLAITSVACVPTKAGGVQVNVSLSAPAKVAAEVLNIAGRPVRALCRDQACVAGSNVLLWNGRSDYGTQAPPGLYLIRLTARTDDRTERTALATVPLR